MSQFDLYEITIACADDDWVSRRVPCRDFHDAAKAAFDWINMASLRDGDKLYGARLLRVERLPAVSADLYRCDGPQAVEDDIKKAAAELILAEQAGCTRGAQSVPSSNDRSMRVTGGCWKEE